VLTRKKIIKEIGSPFLALHEGIGYYFFVYEEQFVSAKLENCVDIFETHSVYVDKLDDLDLWMWVQEGRDFCKNIQERSK
jgi:hypothetical protein